MSAIHNFNLNIGYIDLNNPPEEDTGDNFTDVYTTNRDFDLNRGCKMITTPVQEIKIPLNILLLKIKWVVKNIWQKKGKKKN
ncbi:hypothetical protein ACET3Z_013369 [Daucus carota]